MPTYTFYALDEEFAVSTGSNVNSGSGTSTFDYPPTSSMNLMITSNAGDPSPKEFSVGDTYDVTYGANGGLSGQTLNDAVVIRSDDLAGGGSVVVFEGYNDDGELEQVVWTPGFDLEAWYFANFDKGQSPGFYTTDQDPGSQYQYVCFSGDTLIRTPTGFLPAARLQIGGRLVTRDQGAMPILWIGRRTVTLAGAPRSECPIEIKPTAFGMDAASSPVVVSPQHRIAIGLPRGQERLVPAKALLGWPGVRQKQGKKRITYFSLLLPRHAILNAGGLAAESLFPGPQALRRLGPVAAQAINHALMAENGRGIFGYPALARPALGTSAARRHLLAGARPLAFEEVLPADTRPDKADRQKICAMVI